MKIRNGFVSNSSSSSFILALEEYPTDVKDFQKLLFPDGRQEVHYCDSFWPSYDIAHHIFNDIHKENRASVGAIFDFFHEIAYCNKKDVSRNSHDGWLNVEMKDGDVLENAWQLTKEYIKNYENHYIVILGYSDDTMFTAAIEHGGILEKIGATRLSQH